MNEPVLYEYEIDPEMLDIPTCSTCKSRETRPPVMVRSQVYELGTTEVTLGSAWLCPEINLFTCDEAPGCTKYKQAEGE